MLVETGYDMPASNYSRSALDPHLLRQTTERPPCIDCWLQIDTVVTTRSAYA